MAGGCDKRALWTCMGREGHCGAVTFRQKEKAPVGIRQGVGRWSAGRNHHEEVACGQDLQQDGTSYV